MDMVEVGWRKAEDGGGEGGVRCFDENEAEERVVVGRCCQEEQGMQGKQVSVMDACFVRCARHSINVTGEKGCESG